MFDSSFTHKPWAKGPFELLKHADGHFRTGSDTDRRIALIGFDNSIEVSIDVFVKLHPRQRGGLVISKEEVDAATRNYHTKIEFFEKWANQTHAEVDAGLFECVIWYHKLRNELYHSGNGMVPEIHVIEGARGTAIRVFESLFDFDPVPFLDPERRVDSEDSLPYMGSKNILEFLREFSDFEKAVAATAKEEGWRGAASDIRGMVNYIKEHLVDTLGEPLLDVCSYNDIINSIDIRDRIIRDNTEIEPHDEDQLVESMISLKSFKPLLMR